MLFSTPQTFEPKVSQNAYSVAIYYRRFIPSYILVHNVQATPSEKPTRKRHRFIGLIVFPVYLPNQVIAILHEMPLAIGYRTHFVRIS